MTFRPKNIPVLRLVEDLEMPEGEEDKIESSDDPNAELKGKIPENLYRGAFHYACSLTGGDEERTAQLLSVILTELLLDEGQVEHELALIALGLSEVAHPTDDPEEEKDEVPPATNFVRLFDKSGRDWDGDTIRYESSEDLFDPEAPDALDRIMKELDELAPEFWNR